MWPFNGLFGRAAPEPHRCVDRLSLQVYRCRECGGLTVSMFDGPTEALSVVRTLAASAAEIARHQEAGR